jgi:large subunit ribosomal protein L10
VKREKQLLLEEMKEQMKRSNSFIVTRYQQMTGPRAFAFRRELSKIGGYFEVVRKRMLVQASNQLGIAFETDQFPGHIGIILGSQDPIAMTKLVLKFSSENDKTFDLVGGYFDGQKISAEDVQKMATLPGKEQMRAEFLGLLESPAANLLAVMEALLTGVVSCVEQRSQEPESN